jgi:hypothetical protein
MEADPERGLLDRVVGIKDFFQSVLYKDSLDDWKLAKDFGEFLIRIGPEQVIGHALVARASRHLGDMERAYKELEQCRTRPKHPAETELFLSFLAEEEKLLPEGPRKGERDKT